MRVLDLFSGIGGFSLGLERAGMTTVAFCEIDPFCRAVLKKHWPNVPIFDDVRTLTNEQTGPVDVICGGFPCQDISFAGKGAGIDGERSGLWKEYSRLIGEIRPRYVIVENVAALLGRGLGRVLGDLAKIGYNSEWHCIPASAVGAPHCRDRVWIIANANGDRPQIRTDDTGNSKKEASRKQARGAYCRTFSQNDICSYTELWEQSLGWASGRDGWLVKSIQRNRDWKITTEPVLARGEDGIPKRLDRLKSLGNAVVPQIPELLGRAIMQAHSKE